MNVGPMGGW